MSLPFTPREFLAVFSRYNEAAWPAPVLLTLLAAATLVVAARGGPRAGRVVGTALALLWAWMALAYHAAFFLAVNPAAGLFAGAFLVAAALFAWHGWRGGLAFPRPAPPGRLAPGGGIALAALIAYPVLGLLAGHRYPAFPTFGLPCPTTIYTLGILLLAQRARWPLYVVPLAWSAVGSNAAFELGMHEDLMLLVAAVATVGVLGWRVSQRRSRQVTRG